MNSLEMVMAAVYGSERDKTPATLTLSLYGAGLTGCPLRDFYNNPARYVEGQSAIKKAFDPDILFTPFVLTAIGEAFGSEVIYFDKTPPNIIKADALTPDDVLKFNIDEISDHPRMHYLYNAAGLLASGHAGDTAVAGIFLSRVDMMPLIMGLDAWLETVLFNESEAVRIIEMMTPFFVKAVNELFSRGVHIVALPVAFCNPMVVTERIIKKIALPSLNDALIQVNGPIILHHVGAPMNSFIGLLQDLPNIAGFLIDQSDPFEAARDGAGTEKVLLGNIDGSTLNRKSPESIKKICRSILTERGRDRHFIFASSGADIPIDTPVENIKAVFDTVKEFSGGV